MTDMSEYPNYWHCFSCGGYNNVNCGFYGLIHNPDEMELRELETVLLSPYLSPDEERLCSTILATDRDEDEEEIVNIEQYYQIYIVSYWFPDECTVYDYFDSRSHQLCYYEPKNTICKWSFSPECRPRPTDKPLVYCSVQCAIRSYYKVIAVNNPHFRSIASVLKQITQ
jgi:hypothetical protein